MSARRWSPELAPGLVLVLLLLAVAYGLLILKLLGR